MVQYLMTDVVHSVLLLILLVFPPSKAGGCLGLIHAQITYSYKVS